MRLSAIIILAVVARAVAAQAAPFAADEHTLFLAHYDQSLKADVAKGDPKPIEGAAAITSGRGGRYGEGVVCKEGPTKDAGGKAIQFTQFSHDLKNNLNLAKGTVEFWTKLDDLGNAPAGKSRLRYFFDVPGKEKDSTGNLVRCTIVLTEIDGVQTLYVFPGKLVEDGVNTGRGDSISVRTTWQRGEWHHVAVTWDGTKLVLFADGKAGEPLALRGGLFGGNKTYIDALDGVFLIGGLFQSGTVNAPDGVIDEFRISDTVRYTNDFDSNR